MASGHEHDIVKALGKLIAAVGTLPNTAKNAAVITAVDDLRAKLAVVGYHVG